MSRHPHMVPIRDHHDGGGAGSPRANCPGLRSLNEWLTIDDVSLAKNIVLSHLGLQRQEHLLATFAHEQLLKLRHRYQLRRLKCPCMEQHPKQKGVQAENQRRAIVYFRKGAYGDSAATRLPAPCSHLSARF